MSHAESLARKAIRDFGLPPEAEGALVEVYESVDRSYRDRFVELTAAMREQAAALRRIQETLHVLVMAIKPELADKAPVAFRIAAPDEKADVASVSVELVDPISAGYTLSQKDVAEALGLDPPDVSRLVKAFKLADDADCAVVVRAGQRRIVNYHPVAVERLRQLVKSPPSDLTDEEKKLVRRVKKKVA